MFFIASKIFDFFGSPSRLALALLALGVALAYTRGSKSGRRLATLGVILVALIFLGPLAQFLAAPLEARFPALQDDDDIPPPDGIIVLGGSVDEALSAERHRPVLTEAAERLTAPIALLRRFPQARLVFSGGSAALGGSATTEAEAVRQFWRAVGLDRGQVAYEDRSRNTYENAAFTRALVQPEAGARWLLITSAMHMPRAVGVFREVGFPVVPYPVDFRTDGRLFSLNSFKSSGQGVSTADFAGHEWVGLVAYWLTGRSAALFPAP